MTKAHKVENRQVNDEVKARGNNEDQTKRKTLSPEP